MGKWSQKTVGLRNAPNGQREGLLGSRTPRHWRGQGWDDAFCDAVAENVKDIYGQDETAPAESTNILCVKCGSPTVKPATVLFGGSLPDAFFQLSEEDLPAAIC